MASNSVLGNGEMANGCATPQNGLIGHSTPANHLGTLDETLHHMNMLIKENSDLKESLKHTNMSMKERFENLALWKEKQKEDREFLEKNVQEARERVSSLTKLNEELRKKLQAFEDAGTDKILFQDLHLEIEQLKTMINRLKAEKSDLVAMNSELQLKLGNQSPENSFVEIRIAEGEKNPVNNAPNDSLLFRNKYSEDTNTTLDSEELTVCQLLQSLRSESQKVEKLHLQLQAADEKLRAAEERVTEIEIKKGAAVEDETQTEVLITEIATQTIETCRGADKKDEMTSYEVDNLKSQVKSLFEELQQTQSNMDEAEKMKKTLQEKCLSLEQNLSTLQVQLGDKQQILHENEKLKLQLDSLQSVNKMGQAKTEEDKRKLAQLQEAYKKLFEDYNESKKMVEGMKARQEEGNELFARLHNAEEALAAKQLKIDEMQQHIFKQEQELETVSVFKAQAEVYSSDFYAERAAREKIHEEKERLAFQVEFLKKQNAKFQEDLEQFGRLSLNDMKERHVPRGASPPNNVQQMNARGARAPDNRDWQQVTIPEHACPKCNEVLPDIDSLQIHVMDCII
ncbi:optineurin isoform X2 [Polypterus senegalus]|uniref:optineurin isoform X2 n=1 Tax=Polypterus senegalus TaxID=55291 RepID=UPI0019646925|nr:optineurin isoform X2 [Polypterus senegalus]